jgi:hypothetical protein
MVSDHTIYHSEMIVCVLMQYRQPSGQGVAIPADIGALFGVSRTPDADGAGNVPAKGGIIKANYEY